jgi:hypothetical protein
MRREPAEHSPPPAREVVALWVGVLAGPVLVLAQQTTAYALVPDACARQHSTFVQLTHGVALLLIAGAFLLLHRIWRRYGGGEPGPTPTPSERTRFLAFTGMLGNGFFALIVAAMWLATLLFSPCSA